VPGKSLNDADKLRLDSEFFFLFKTLENFQKAAVFRKRMPIAGVRALARP
jgi:hypothetical protein